MSEALVQRFAKPDFGAGVAGGAEKPAGGHGRFTNQAGNAEIGKHRMCVGVVGEQHVARLDVAVNHTR
jgi:hypothetical protein